MKNLIALHYRNAIVLPYRRASAPQNDITPAIYAEMVRLGFVPSSGLMEKLETLPTLDLKNAHQELISSLKKLVGDDVQYEPLYPNFPQQVMDASDAELLINAIVHYLSYGLWRPQYFKLPREVAYEHRKLRTIGVLNEDEFNDIFASLVSSNESLSDFDKQTVEWFILSGRELHFPHEIPFKENLCLVAGILLNQGLDVTPLINTATDVLRIAAYLSGGDISLAEPTKFKSLSRSTRRQLTMALEQVASEEDIARYRNRWIKLFHNLHVGDYSNKVYQLAKKVRNNEKIQTFNGRVQDAIDRGKIDQAVQLLQQRPSEFARRLDHLLRLSDFDKQSEIVSEFANVANKVPTRTLLQLMGHIKNRHVPEQTRVAFPKGNTQRAVQLPEQEPLNEQVVNDLTVAINMVLIDRFSEQDYLGAVWIDPELQYCPVPTQMRSASTGLRQVARGTRLPFGDEDQSTLRLFIYWVGQDIDLSATLHDENFKMIDHVAYTNLRSDVIQAYHSGDIVFAPDGASEFIDINIDQAAKHGRYLAMNVYVFSGPLFADHETVYAGWMTRSKPNSNEVYEPSTVEQKIDVTANSRNNVPVVFDLVERKAIWVDLNVNPAHFRVNNVLRNRATTEQTVNAIVSMNNKVSLYDLFSLHAASRGAGAETREQADTVFALSGDDATVTPFDIDTINSEYIK